VRIQLKPGLQLITRGPSTVQIGLDARHGAVLDGLTDDDVLGQGTDIGDDHRLVEEIGCGHQRRLAGLNVGQDDQPAAGEEVDRLCVSN